MASSDTNPLGLPTLPLLPAPDTRGVDIWMALQDNLKKAEAGGDTISIGVAMQAISDYLKAPTGIGDGGLAHGGTGLSKKQFGAVAQQIAAAPRPQPLDYQAYQALLAAGMANQQAQMNAMLQQQLVHGIGMGMMQAQGAGAGSLFGAGAQAALPPAMSPWRAMGFGSMANTEELRLRSTGLRYLPNHFGWRCWKLNAKGYLVSPHRGDVWDEETFHAANWSKDDAVRGVAGIHALHAPEMWRDLVFPEAPYAPDDVVIYGLLERWGEFVLGTEGWRSEWAVIRELQFAPQGYVSTKGAGRIVEHLQRNYPNVVVHDDSVESRNQEKDRAYRRGHRDRDTGDTVIQPRTDHGADPGATRRAVITRAGQIAAARKLAGKDTGAGNSSGVTPTMNARLSKFAEIKKLLGL